MSNDYLAKVELLADLFYIRFGMMALGKDYSPSVPPPPDLERRETYDLWRNSNLCLDDALTYILRLKTRIESLKTQIDDIL